jgi:hypothetical protein
MNRYKNTTKRYDKSGKIVFGTTYYPEIPLHNDDRLYRTITGDRIDNIAFSFYEDVTLWWVIAKANGLKEKMVLKPNTLIRIPGDVSSILLKFAQLNR